MIGKIALAQFSPVQSSEGTSSFIINSGTNINANFEDSKIEFSSYIGPKLEKFKNIDIRYHASFKAADGISDIIKERKVSPVGSVGLTFLHYTAQSADKGAGIAWFYLTAAHSAANFTLYNDKGTFSNLTLEEYEQNSTLTIGFNTTNQKNFSFGLGVQTILSSNNYARLEDNKILTQVFIPNSTNDTIQSVVLEEVEAKGPLSRYQNDFTEVNVVGDLLYWPKELKSQLAIGLHLKGNYTEISKPLYNSAIGFYITKAKKEEEEDPTAIVGGIVIEFKDLFGTATQDKFLDRGVISLVVGYTFGLK